MNKENSYNVRNIGLFSWITKICEKKNIFYLTPVQQASIPAIIAGKDSILFSRTGTGKTLSFILPLLHIEYMCFSNCFITIFVPTIELGVQICETYNYFGINKQLSGIFLNKPYKYKILNKEKRGCFISTLFFFNTEFMGLYEFTNYVSKILVFDETDMLIKPENFVIIKKIILKVNPSQINLLGVTITNILSYISVFTYQKCIFFFYEKINSFSYFTEIKHEYIYCSAFLKFKFLLILLKSRERIKNQGGGKWPILIFSKNKNRSENLIRLLKNNKILTANLNHEMNEQQRILSVQMIKKGILTTLISTDLGSRGMNFSFINFMINLDVPAKIEMYIHRTGRIGRFKRKGYCLNLVDKHEINFIHSIEKASGININKAKFLFKKETF